MPEAHKKYIERQLASVITQGGHPIYTLLKLTVWLKLTVLL